MCARKEGHKETIVNKQSKMRRALGSGVAGVAALAMLATGTAHAANDTYYSSKQPYIVPQQAVEMSYSAAPEGYAITYTEMLARHGSRGLSSYKYDALLKLMGETAAEENGFVSEEARNTFMSNVQAIIDANVENGYGMLTGQGATQHQGIGTRAYQRNKALFDQAAADGETIEYESSGEQRATESGENFKLGFDTASGYKLADSYVKPTAPAGEGDAAPFQKSPNTLYFHKTDNPDGSEKDDQAAAIASRYEDFVDNDKIIANAEDYIEDVPQSEKASYDLMSQIFTDDFLKNIGKDEGRYSWYNTTTGEKDSDEDGKADDGSGTDIRNCAIEGDPDELMAEYGEDICGETGKHITSVVDAAMDLYNLYIIAADMQEENTGDHTFDFDRYFTNISSEDGDVFAWILDMEDFYEKGPSYAGQNETYRIAQPLLDDFFNSIDDRVDGGTTAATFRFAHAETIIPFAALIKAPGSEEQIPQDKIYDPLGLLGDQGYQSNWYGESVTPMAANIQWDVATKDGKDPKTGKAYTPLVRMLYNETEVPFNASCTPVAEGSTWYKESELKSCLGLNTGESTEDPTITVETGTSGGQQQDGNTQNDQKQDAGDATKQPSASDRPKTIPKTGSAMIVPAVAGVVLVAAGVTLVFVRRAKRH